MIDLDKITMVLSRQPQCCHSALSELQYQYTLWLDLSHTKQALPSRAFPCSNGTHHVYKLVSNKYTVSTSHIPTMCTPALENIRQMIYFCPIASFLTREQQSCHSALYKLQHQYRFWLDLFHTKHSLPSRILPCKNGTRRLYKLYSMKCTLSHANRCQTRNKSLREIIWRSIDSFCFQMTKLRQITIVLTCERQSCHSTLYRLQYQ